MSQSLAASRQRHGVSLRGLPLDPAAVAAWLAPFVLIVYLALQNGGYDLVLRSQVGIAVWWIVLLGALVGVLPAVRISRAGWAGLALLAGFVAWTALSLGWTESHERTAVELGKVSAYLGLFALALAAQGRVAMRHAINGTAAAIALVGLLAVLYRLHPQWFSLSDTDRILNSQRRLNYPLGYWNALAALMAMGMPLLAYTAATARTIAMRALAAAALPVLALCAFLTLSRGGIGMVVVGLVVFVALSGERLFRVATLGAAGAGAAILIAAADARGGVGEAGRDAIALHQDAQVLRLVIVVCVAVALLQVAIALLERHVGVPAWATPSRRRTGLLAGGGLALALVVFVAAGGPGWASGQWDQFKSSSAPPSVNQHSAFSRLSNVSGNGRYQYWQIAAAARDSHPLGGTGSGTFEFVWLRSGTQADTSFVRDAHSLWMETQGELGIVGLLLIGGFFLLTLGTGAARALRDADPHRRLGFAAATAGVAAFGAAATVEWVWEMAVLPAIALLLAALVLGGGPPRWVRLLDAPWRRGRARLALGVLVLPAVIAIAIPLASTTALRDSQAEAHSQNLTGALGDAKTAAAIEPQAASPLLQQALIYERAGSLDAAARLARAATRHEPANWRNWLILSRIEAERGHAAASVAAFRRGRTLNPHSGIFAR